MAQRRGRGKAEARGKDNGGAAVTDQAIDLMPGVDEMATSDSADPQNGGRAAASRGPVPDVNSQWAEQINHRPLLTHEQEIELAKRIRAGDEEARKTFIESNLKLVVSVARRYRGTGVPMEDLIAEGNIGLIKAVDHYDYTRGTRFSTIAVHWIEQGVRRAISDLKHAVHVPERIIEELNHLNRARDALMQQHGRQPTLEELAEYLKSSDPTSKSNWSLDKVEALLDIPLDAGSLDVPIDDNIEVSLVDNIEDESADFTEDENWSVSKPDVQSWLERLHKSEREIVELKFGLNGHREHTLEEIGHRFQPPVSRQRVRQIIATALKRIRNYDRRVRVT